MRRFIVKGILFILLGCGIAVGLSAFSNYFDPVFPAETFIMRQLMEQKDHVDALAVGGSHSNDLDFGVLGYNGYHVWQPANDVFEVEYQLKKLIPQLPAVKTVFYSIPYFPFQHDNRVIAENGEIRIALYYSLPSRHWIKEDFSNYLMAQLAPIIRPDHWRGIVGNFQKGKNRSDPSLIMQKFHIATDGRRIDPKAFQILSKDELKIWSDDPLKGVAKHLSNIAESEHGNPRVKEETCAALERTIQFLQQRNIRVVFFTIPFYESYTKLFDKNIIAETDQRMQQLKRKYGVEYYDFSRNKDFVYNNQYFSDDDHMNLSVGAVTFSKELRVLLKKHENKGSFKWVQK